MLQRRPEILPVMVLDVLVTIESMLVAVLFRFEGMVPEGYWNRSLLFALFAAVVLVVLLIVGGAYGRGASREVASATARHASLRGWRGSRSVLTYVSRDGRTGKFRAVASRLAFYFSRAIRSSARRGSAPVRP